MFETAVLSNGSPKKRVWATIAGMTGQAMLIGFALLAPLMWPQAIPKVAWAIALAAPGPPPPPPPPPPKREETIGRVTPVSESRVFRAPISVPKEPPRIIVDAPQVASSADGVVGGMVGGEKGGMDGGILSIIVGQVQRPPVKPPDPVPPRERVVATPPKTPVAPPRISRIEMARPIHRVEPVYPRLAVTARIQGTVRLMGVLGVDGRIRELQVLSGHPLLVNAAVEAVKQWIYAPTMLNGQAVEVQAPIEVNFILNR